jgi:hypothetical protein
VPTDRIRRLRFDQGFSIKYAVPIEFGPERGGVFDCGRGLLLLALRLRTAGASLVTLVRMLMRMVVWLLPRCLCAAVLREDAYRRRQDEGHENHAKECLTDSKGPTGLGLDLRHADKYNSRMTPLPRPASG